MYNKLKINKYQKKSHELQNKIGKIKSKHNLS